MNLRTVYGIYNQLDQFLADDAPPPPNRVEAFKQSVTKYGENLKEKFRGTSQNKQEEEVHIQSQAVPSTNQPRSSSLWGKIERTWDDATKKTQTTKTQINTPKNNETISAAALNAVNKPPPSPLIQRVPKSQQTSKTESDLSQSNNKQRSIFGEYNRSPMRSGNEFQNVLDFQKRFEVVSRHPSDSRQTKMPVASTEERRNPHHELTKPKSSSYIVDLDNSSHGSVRDITMVMKEDLESPTDDGLIEEIFYVDDESQVLQEMIRKLGSSPTIDKVGMLLERLTLKDNAVKKQISELAAQNSHLFGGGYVLIDSIVFRVNSCHARIQRSRDSIKMIKENQVNLGTAIQSKLKLQKLHEYNLLYMRKFKDRYQLLLDLLTQFKSITSHAITSDTWTLAQFKTTKEKVLRGLSDPTEQQFMKSFECLSTIRFTVEQSYQRMLEMSYEFFKDHIIKVFLQQHESHPEQFNLTVGRMADIFQEFQITGFKFNASTALRKQFRLMLKKQAIPNPTNLSQLVAYLRQFLASFYEFTYSLQNIVVPARLASSFHLEKQDFWPYAQKKLCKVMKNMKFTSLVDCDLWNFLSTLERIIKIGEELSSQSSEKLLQQLDGTIRALVQALGEAVSAQLQQGALQVIRHTRYKTPDMFTLNWFRQKRIQQKSNYLVKLLKPDELLTLLTKLSDPPQNENERFGNKTYHLSVIQVLQKLQVVGEALPYLAVDCLLYTLSSFEVFCLLQLRRSVPPDSIQLLMKQVHVPHNVSLEELAALHTIHLHQRQHANLRQLVFRSSNLLHHKSNNNIPALGLETLQNIFDYIKEGFTAICDDKELLDEQIGKQSTCLTQLKRFIVRQQAWLYYQLDADVAEQAITQFRIAKQTQLLGCAQWVIECNALTLQHKMITKGVAHIIKNTPAFMRALQDINRIVNSSDAVQDAFVQHFIALLERGNMNLVLQNKWFPLQISCHFIDTKNQNLVKSLVRDYTDYIESLD